MTEAGGSDPVLGILGGLGPGATVSFMNEVLEQTPAQRDQDHIEMVVYNDPKVPDRNYPERRSSEGPLPRLIRNAKRLETAGADYIVIASNTTHRYHDEIATAVTVPVPHMISLVRDEVTAADVGSVGILTTTTAIDIGLFDEQFQDTGIEVVYPDDRERMMEAIYAFKRGEKEEAKRLMDECVEVLLDQGVEAAVLGCTELSALPWEWDVPSIDPAAVLANHCVERSYSPESS
jgi:aspartate racemase